MLVQEKKDSTYYLKLMERFQIEPNFWCSEEYFKKAGFILKQLKDCYWIEDEEWITFPPIDTNGHIYPPMGNKGIWSDFNGYSIINKLPDFLDYEYLYNPKNFLNMVGGSWQTFRKNIRKWPKRNEQPTYIIPSPNDDLIPVLKNWLESDPNRIIEDDEVLLKYILEGENKKVLAGLSGKIYAINIWDENYRYINFRYCICNPEPFLSEYARYLFYTDPFILNKNKLVNDGGRLDKPSLEFFKDKMNPVRVRAVYSWRIK